MIKIGKFWWIMAGMALLLQAGGCVPAEPTDPPQTGEDAVLPNIVVQVEGQVLLRRVGWEDFLPAGFGTVVGPGDLLQVPDGAQAAVFCGDIALWDEGPQTLPGDASDLARGWSRAWSPLPGGQAAQALAGRGCIAWGR